MRQNLLSSPDVAEVQKTRSLSVGLPVKEKDERLLLGPLSKSLDPQQSERERDGCVNFSLCKLLRTLIILID